MTQWVLGLTLTIGADWMNSLASRKSTEIRALDHGADLLTLTVGKKNWLFIGSEEAGWRSAVIYSIMQSCRSRGIDPYEYLVDVLQRIPTMTNHQIGEITPAAWAATRDERLRFVS